MVEDPELTSFKTLAEWAQKIGARRIKSGANEIEFFSDPSVFFAPPPGPVDGAKEDAAIVEQKARERRLYRSA